MADKNPVAADGTVPGVDQTGDGQSVRNVVLVGHTGAGKTTLVEALLVATGTIHRAGRVEDGTTVSDHDEAELRQQRSVSLSLAPFHHQGIKVNLLDTPGYADFVGDLRAGLRAADCALFVVSTAEAIDGSTRMLWAECAAVGMPRAVVLTKLDHPRSDYEGTLAACREAFGEKVLPLYLPVTGADGATTGLIGMLSGRLFDYSAGTRTESDPSSDDSARLEAARGELIEGVIEESEDESLMDRYLGGEEIDQKVLIDDLEQAVAKASFHPVIPVCAATGLGTAELLEIITSAFPAPTEHPIPEVYTVAGKTREGLSCDPAGPLLAEIVKTTTDAYVGRISLVRVFSGTLRPDQTVHVSGHFLSDRGHEDHDEDERIGAVTSPLGKTQRPVASCAAGDICAIAKLSRAETGDTLSGKDDPLVMRPWEMPEPLLPVAIVAHAKADEDKLSQGLQRLAAEDPTLRIENNPETHQLVLWTIGEAHAAARDVRRHGPGSRPARQAVRRARPVRGLRRRGRATARGRGFRVRRQGRGRVGAPAVHPVGREGRAGPDGAGHDAGRLPRRRHQGHALRRQGAQRRLLRHGLPDRRRAGAAGGSGRRGREPAGTGRRGRRPHPRRLRRQRDGRPVQPSRAGARHRAGRRRPYARARGGAADRDRPLRDRPARDEPWHGNVHPHVRPLRADAPAPGGEGEVQGRLSRCPLITFTTLVDGSPGSGPW
jgi:elongation factor G